MEITLLKVPLRLRRGLSKMQMPAYALMADRRTSATSQSASTSGCPIWAKIGIITRAPFGDIDSVHGSCASPCYVPCNKFVSCSDVTGCSVMVKDRVDRSPGGVQRVWYQVPACARSTTSVHLPVIGNPCVLCLQEVACLQAQNQSIQQGREDAECRAAAMLGRLVVSLQTSNLLQQSWKDAKRRAAAMLPLNASPDVYYRLAVSSFCAAKLTCKQTRHSCRR